jgi:hypothetical protein
LGQHQQRTARPWQARGDSETIAADIQQPDEGLEWPESAAGVAESKTAIEQVLALDKKTRAAAWGFLKKEFSVQKMIWESMALMKKAQMAHLGKKPEEQQEPAEAVLLKDFEAVLGKATSNPDAACEALEETLQKDKTKFQLLSKSMEGASRAAMNAEAISKKRSELVNILEAAPGDPVSAESRKDMLQELSDLLQFCDLGKTPATYCVRRVLMWRLGAFMSDLVIPMSCAWNITDEDCEDPWVFYPPDPSISPPGSDAEAEKVHKKARGDVSSLKVKHKKGDHSPSSPSSSASPTKAKKGGVGVDEQLPVQPPSALATGLLRSRVSEGPDSQAESGTGSSVVSPPGADSDATSTRAVRNSGGCVTAL